MLAGTALDASVPDSAAYVIYGPLDPDGGSTVAPTSSFHVRFNRLLDPTTANRQAFCVRPVLGNVAGPADCINGIFTTPSYDPVKREVAFHLTAGTGNLVPGTRYELTLYAAPEVSGGGVMSYDGVALAQTYQVEFDIMNIDPDGGLPQYETGPTGDHFCTPPPNCDAAAGPCPRSVSVMLSGCALGGCHGISTDPDAGAAGMPSEGLNLSNLDAIGTTALNQPAHETQTGENAGQVQIDGLRFGRNMAVLSTSGPGYSYLVYKLLANRLLPLTVPWPDGSLTVDPTEVALLRQSIVVGMPMPPDTATSSMLLPGEPEWLSEWLLQGAPVPAQPCP